MSSSFSSEDLFAPSAETRRLSAHLTVKDLEGFPLTDEQKRNYLQLRRRFLEKALAQWDRVSISYFACLGTDHKTDVDVEEVLSSFLITFQRSSSFDSIPATNYLFSPVMIMVSTNLRSYVLRFVHPLKTSSIQWRISKMNACLQRKLVNYWINWL